MRQILKSLGTSLAILLLSGNAGAAASPDDSCKDGEDRVGWLGIVGFRGAHMTMDDSDLWFAQEPEVYKAEGPARGRVRRGDVIIAIDSTLITTRDGGRRLFRPEPNETVTLTVRRNRRETTVEVTAKAVCPEDRLQFGLITPPGPEPPVALAPVVAPSAPVFAVPPAPEPPGAPRASAAPVLAVPAAPGPPGTPRAFAAPAPAAPLAVPGVPAVPRASAAPVLAVPSAPPAPSASPAPPAPAPPAPAPPSPVWYGFGFECKPCRFESGADGRHYFFGAPPSIFSVDPDSPAERAGLRRGDVLTHADDLPMTTDEGARRLFETEPGATIRLTYERDGAVDETEIRAEERPARLRNVIERLRGELAAISRNPGQVDVSTAYRNLSQQLETARSKVSGQEHLRYAGTLGDVDLEVHGLDSVYVKVDEAGGVVEIRTLDATIRLERQPEAEAGVKDP